MISKNEKGATLVEYALLVALVAIAAMAAMRLLATSVSSSFSAIGSGLDSN